jgi:hypothetical protein
MDVDRAKLFPHGILESLAFFVAHFTVPSSLTTNRSVPEGCCLTVTASGLMSPNWISRMREG